MRITKFPDVSATFAVVAGLTLLVLLPACSLSVKKNEKGGGEKVDIQTPVGGIHVSQDANPRDTGLATYPGARQKEKRSDRDGNNANVNISSGFFGIKVVAIEFVSDDPPEKVAAFYRDQLKKYGAVLECHTDNPHQDAGDADVELGKDDKAKSKKLTCEHDSGKSLELKVGSKDNQHIVSISPQDKGKGTDFALVFVQAHGSSRDTI